MWGGVVRIYHFSCYICDHKERATDMKDAWARAEKHEKEHHKAKPVAAFGWSKTH